MTEIRTLTIKDIRQAKMLSDAEQWNQTEQDWALLIKEPANICLAVESKGKITGTATAMNYGNEIAWIGMVLVHRDYRGKGISKLLLTELLKRLKSCKSVKLDATPAGEKVYQKFGFIEEYRMYRMTNDAVNVPGVSPLDSDSYEISLINNLTEINAFDQHVFGANRRPLLNYLAESFPENAWVIKKNAQFKGFALGRKGTLYNHIGPVSAATVDEAKALIIKALGNLAGQPVVVDVPAYNEPLINWFGEMGFSTQRYLIRMHKDKIAMQEKTEYQMLLSGPEFG